MARVGGTTEAREPAVSIEELAALWNISKSTAYRLAKNEPGVIKILIGKKKANTTYRIPESVLARMKQRMQAG